MQMIWDGKCPYKYFQEIIIPSSSAIPYKWLDHGNVGMYSAAHAKQKLAQHCVILCLNA